MFCMGFGRPHQQVQRVYHQGAYRKANAPLLLMPFPLCDSPETAPCSVKPNITFAPDYNLFPGQPRRPSWPFGRIHVLPLGARHHCSEHRDPETHMAEQGHGRHPLGPRPRFDVLPDIHQIPSPPSAGIKPRILLEKVRLLRRL